MKKPPAVRLRPVVHVDAPSLLRHPAVRRTVEALLSDLRQRGWGVVWDALPLPAAVVSPAAGLHVLSAGESCPRAEALRGAGIPVISLVVDGGSFQISASGATPCPVVSEYLPRHSGVLREPRGHHVSLPVHRVTLLLSRRTD